VKEDKNYFFKWLKKETSHNPPLELDQKILHNAHAVFSKNQNNFRFVKLLKPGLALALSLAFLIVLNNKFNPQTKGNNQLLSFNESPEMILNYKDIELMAAVGSLNDQDWKKIEATQ